MLTATERQLVLNCSREGTPPELLRQTGELLQADLKWGHILHEARRHGVASLLYKSLKKAEGAEAAPAEALRKLLQLYNRTALRNHFLAQSLVEILERFGSSGIEAVVLKGPCLSQLVYSESASRPYRDLDLLVRKEDLARAREHLLGAGFKAPPGLLADGFFRRYHFSLPLVREADENTTHVELHWGLADVFMGADLDMGPIWERARPAVMFNREALSLSTEDLLIHLCLHLDMHGYLNRAIVGRGDEARCVFHPLSENRIIWFTDLLELIGKYREEIDWEALVERSRAQATEVSLSTSLRLLNSLFGAVVEGEVLEELALPRPNIIGRGLLGRLLSGAEEASGGGAPHRAFFRSKLLATRPGTQLRLIRLVGIWDYVFPGYGIFAKRRASARRTTVLLLYLKHVAEAVAYCALLSLHTAYYYLTKRLVHRPDQP